MSLCYISWSNDSGNSEVQWCLFFFSFILFSFVKEKLLICKYFQSNSLSWKQKQCCSLLKLFHRGSTVLASVSTASMNDAWHPSYVILEWQIKVSWFGWSTKHNWEKYFPLFLNDGLFVLCNKYQIFDLISTS